MNKLTLGTAQLGMSYGVNNKTGKPLISESLSILEFASNNNINSFDTASNYGNSEIILGAWLKKKQINSIYLTSKISSLNSQCIQKTRLEGEIRKRIENSLKNMNVKKINNLLIHDFNDVKYYGSDIFRILEKMKNENVLDSYGCSIYDLEELDYVSEFNIGTIQIPGSIFNQNIIESKLIGQMRMNGIAVFVRSIFVQGLIFMDNLEIPINLRGLGRYIKKLQQLVQLKNVTIAEVAFNYVRNHPNTDSVVFGVETINQLKELISIKTDKILDYKDIIKEFSEIPSELIDPRFWK